MSPCGVIGDVITLKKYFQKWPPFWGRDKLFLPEGIPEIEYASKLAIKISGILSFWSML